MAFALVQTVSNNGTGAVDATLAAVGASGRVLRVGVFWQNNAALDNLVTKISGVTQADVATAVGTRQFFSSGGLNGFSYQEFVFLAPSSGVTTVTAVSTGHAVDLFVQEHSGFTTTPTIKIPASPYASTTTSNSSASGAVTTDVANAVVCSSCFPSGGATSASDGTGWTTDSGGGDANWGGGGYGHRFVSATGTYGPVTWVTTSGTSGDANSVFAIQDGTAGGSAPVNTVAPAVTGTTTVGQTLSCTTGTWTGDTSSGFAYQWKDAGGNIASATSSTYVIGAGEAGASIHCTVTATGTGGSTPADSNTVGPIAAIFVPRVIVSQ